MQILLAKSKTDITNCYPIIVQLRTTLSEKEFVERVLKQQKIGYNLAYIKDKKEIVAVTGFRISYNLAWGKFLYVDDLIVDSKNRSKGYGNILFDWLIDYAKKETCNELHLDSGVQRFDAHRFYLKRRMKISSHHFALPL